MLRVGIVAGEASGDKLGAGLMAAIRERCPAARFVGVGGDGMLAEGLVPLAPLDALSVHGFKDPLLRLPSLLRLLIRLRRRFVAEPVDVMVGVDFNVFNLLLERALKKRGFPTAHYVSPSVYFWRPGRVERVKRAADTVLALFPFEPALYRRRGAEAVFVGHPMADEIDPDDGSDAARAQARATLGLPARGPVVALLPGSRRSEIRCLGRLFLDAASRLAEPFDAAVCVIPAPSDAVHAAVQALVAGHSRGRRRGQEVRVVRGRSRLAIAAADLVLTKSGTATLETLLLRRPMVVAYRVGPVTAWIVRRLKRSVFVALPNILAGRALVPELLQERAEPEALARALRAEHGRAAASDEYSNACAEWHRRLRRDAARRAASAVLALVSKTAPRQ